MNMENKETLESTLQPYVEKLLKGLEEGVNFAQENIPEVLEQYILFEAVNSWVYFILFAMVLPAVVFLISKFLEIL